MGGDQRLSELLERLAAFVLFADDDRAVSLRKDLEALRGDQWMRLDELARRIETDLLLPGTARGTAWPVSGTVPDPLAAVAASMSRDGRVREGAVEWLARSRGPAVAAAVAVRCDDWVPAVAECAQAAVGDFDDESEVAAVVGVMLRLVHRRRGSGAASEYLTGVRDGDPDRLLALTRVGERACRVWALVAADTRGLLSPDDLLERALREPDPSIALWCAQRLIHGASADGTAVLDDPARLLGSRRALVRAAAVELLPDAELLQAEGDRPRLEWLLLDPSGGVRILARWRWTRAFGLPTAVYRTALDQATTTSGPGRVTRVVVALDGLSECSLDDAVPGARQLIVDPSPRVRATAVRVLGRAVQRMSVDVDALLPVLDDPANRVAALAARSLRDRAGEIPAATVDRLAASARTRDRLTALRFRQRLGAWERVRRDLMAIADPAPEVCDLGRCDLLAWLQNGAASTYGRPSPDQRDDIAAGLANVTDHGLLSEHRVREIAFVSGLPMPADTATPPETSPAPAPPPSSTISRLRGLLGRHP